MSLTRSQATPRTGPRPPCNLHGTIPAPDGGPGDSVAGATPFDNGLSNLVVLPTYDEADNLERAVHEIRRAVRTDVLVVDDGSPDGTGRIADRLAAEHAAVHVLHRGSKQGLGSAYVAGFRFGLAHGYDRIYEMDADLSHDPADLASIAAAAPAAELVIGSRYVRGGSTRGWSPHRRLLSRSANLYARTLLGVGIRDLTSGFRAYDRRLLERLDLDAPFVAGYGFQIQIAWRARRAGATVVEVPIRFVDRRHGRSKMGPRIVFEALRLVPGLRLGWRA